MRAKLEQGEQLLILRYECISFGGTLVATACVVGAVVYWPPLAWLFVLAALGALGLLFKRTIEEAIAAEELNKIHAMEAVITSNVSLDDSFLDGYRAASPTARLTGATSASTCQHGNETGLRAYRGAIGAYAAQGADGRTRGAPHADPRRGRSRGDP